MAVGSGAEKEFARASRIMGIKWALDVCGTCGICWRTSILMISPTSVDQETVRLLAVQFALLFTRRHSFLGRAKQALVDFDDDDLEAPEGECPVCGDCELSATYPDVIAKAMTP